MASKHKLPFVLIASATLLASTSAHSAGGGRTLTSTLTGSTGSGTATFTVNAGQRTICYELDVTGIDPATAAHIHISPSGAVVVPLDAPTSGSASGCVTDLDRKLLVSILRNPGTYYVNVHNEPFPGGAISGTLTK